ncbi:unnamed protein product [Cladocopium goreaui]|jgi:hypothetical protein|uniref:Uncharacterized protein n=1 Tax=Cladocopium goreaui TaxID=2562237 RepID=A0A9P1BYU2_9DINO|nr:unnamed protein product [Cladocopium goreaui]
MAFERVWLGCGLNAALAGLQVVFSCAVADMDVLSRVMYLKDGKAAWPKVLDLEAFAKTSMQKVAALGNWTEKLDALPGTIDALAKIDSLKVIVLQCLEPLLDFNPSAISNWSGAWTEASSGYILSMVRKPSCTTDVAKITSKLVGAYMKRGSAPPTLSTADPFAGLVKVNLSEPKWKGVLPPTLGDGVVRFVNTGKKRPHWSAETPRPSKTSKVLVASPEFEGPRLLTGNDFLKLMGYKNSVNITLLTDSQQQALLGKSLTFACACLVMDLALELEQLV